MIKQFFFLLYISCSVSVSAQQYDTVPAYLKSKQLPDFSLVSKDSVAFDQSILQANKKTIILLFNPECEHCQDQLTLLLAMPEIKQSAQIVLTTTETLDKLNIFYKKFNLQNYPFVYPGKDTKYIFGKFFQPKTIPVLAFYNNKKQFILVNQGNMSKKKILAALKN